LSRAALPDRQYSYAYVIGLEAENLSQIKRKIKLKICFEGAISQASKCSNFPGIRLCWLSVKQINKINFVLKLPKRNNVTRRQMTTTAAFTLR